MEAMQTSDDDTMVSDESPSFENYLPAGPKPSAESSRVEKFVTNLFRRRGSYRLVVSSAE